MKRMMTIAAAVMLSANAQANPRSDQAGAATNSAALAPSAQPAARVVDAFHAALGRGDTKAALSHLTGDALIYEAGGVERGRQEYASHHLAADAAFAQAVPGTTTRRAGQASGDTAWIASEGRTKGTYKGKPVDRVSAETMILRRVAGAWKIAHIHWSSAAAAK